MYMYVYIYMYVYFGNLYLYFCNISTGPRWNLFTVSQNQLRLARLRSDLGFLGLGVDRFLRQGWLGSGAGYTHVYTHGHLLAKTGDFYGIIQSINGVT